MSSLGIAKKIAGKIESSTQEEIEAMIDIVCEIHDIDREWMFRAVSNLYMKSESYKPAEAANKQAYTESDPR